MKKYLFLLGLLLSEHITTARNPTSYIHNTKVDLTKSQIVKPLAATENEIKATIELQKYLQRITGLEIPIVPESTKAKECEFIIGFTNRTPDKERRNSFAPDEFHLFSEKSSVFITGGDHKGSLYGVYELLEKYLGCRFWAPNAEFTPLQSAIAIPPLNIRSKPAFESREVYYAGMDSLDFQDKMRCDRHAWKGGEDWGLWVHTMFGLVPPEKYFDPHPEYFALMAGKRVQTQLCLSNPDVLKITVKSLKKLMKEHPEKKYWSVSQMDNYGACECENCRKTDEMEGSHSGTMIAFVNKVAKAFPDKIISTLAYQYTRKAPLHLKPAPNVNIMLCTIECDRSKPLQADTSSGSFLSDLGEWAAISNNILVWDYVIQFTNMIAPFPNLPVLQPNIQLFYKYGVRAVFEQGCHSTYSENQELRQYYLSKLLWNPNLNSDSLIFEFLNGYYGAAAPFIHRYLDKMAASLQQSGGLLWIYSSPMQETGSFLTSQNISEFTRLFELAENSVKSDPVLLNRVRMARLPLRYAILEIRKRYIAGPDGFLELTGDKMKLRDGIITELDTFVNQSIRYGVKTYHEKKQSPEAYRNSSMDFFHNAYRENPATRKKYQLSVEPATKYNADGAGSLTDGKRGSPNYFVLWQGFEGEDLTITVDLGKETEFNYVAMEFLQDLASWIFFPTKMKVFGSDDNLRFTEVLSLDSLSSGTQTETKEAGRFVGEHSARYVRFTVTAEKICPAWHIGHGGKAWLFADEVVIDKRPVKDTDTPVGNQ